MKNQHVTTKFIEIWFKYSLFYKTKKTNKQNNYYNTIQKNKKKKTENRIKLRIKRTRKKL